MSGFVDFVIADIRDVGQVVREHNPTRHWPGFEWKWVDKLQLAYLDAILKGNEDRYATQSAFEEAEWHGSASVTVLPLDFNHLLADLGQEEQERVADEWRHCPEFHAGRDRRAAVELMAELCSLARQARAARKSILLRQSGCV